MKKVALFLRKHILSICFAAVTAGLMAWIYSFSGEVSAESNATAEGVCFFIASVFVNGFTGFEDTEQMALILSIVPTVRKIAHFCIFAALGFFSYLTQSTYLIESKKEIQAKKAALYSVIFSLIYAVSDEVHQLFVEGRSGKILDVAIDLSGAVLGVLFAVLIISLFVKIIIKKEQKKKYFE